MMEIELMKDLSEIVRYERSEIPLYIRTADLSAYPDMSAPCHWHEDIEWIHILKGKMHYYVNGRRLLLGEGDSLMVNARQMHYGYSCERQNCRFSCVLFHPSLFCSNPYLFRKYVAPVLKDGSLEYLLLSPDQQAGQETAEFLARIVSLRARGAQAYELEAVAVMHALWAMLWQRALLKPARDEQDVQEDLNIQKDMVSYIYRHYGRKLSLNEIAAAGNVSRSKCCRIFKHYLQQSPIDFLNTYRLKVSCCLLDSSDKNITEIAIACGFPHLSYFSRYFYDVYGVTPREYRKKRRFSPSPEAAAAAEGKL